MKLCITSSLLPLYIQAYNTKPLATLLLPPIHTLQPQSYKKNTICDFLPIVRNLKTHLDLLMYNWKAKLQKKKYLQSLHYKLETIPFFALPFPHIEPTALPASYQQIYNHRTWNMHTYIINRYIQTFYSIEWLLNCM